MRRHSVIENHTGSSSKIHIYSLNQYFAQCHKQQSYQLILQYAFSFQINSIRFNSIQLSLHHNQVHNVNSFISGPKYLGSMPSRSMSSLNPDMLPERISLASLDHFGSYFWPEVSWVNVLSKHVFPQPGFAARTQFIRILYQAVRRLFFVFEIM